MKAIIFTVLLVGYASAKNCDDYFNDVNSRRVGRDVCFSPFASFISCLVGEIEEGIDHVIAESDQQAMQEAQQCFASAGCQVSYDEEKALNTFLPCNERSEEGRKQNCIWRYAADKIIEMLKKTPKPVGKCMIRYFKGIGQRKIEQCTRDYPPNIQPQFFMPEIPGFEDFELDELKNVLIYHVMTRYHLGKCTGCSSSSKPRLIDCLSDQAKDASKEVCAVREGCERPIRETNCAQRFSNVRSAVCACAKGELQKGLAALENWGEMKKVFVRGDWECQLEDCYKQAGLTSQWPSMESIISEVKSSVIKAYIKFQAGKAPKQVAEALFVFKSILGEIVQKWSGLFCGDCNTDGRGSASDIRERSYKKMLDSQSCLDATAEFDLSRGDASVFASLNSNQQSAINGFFDSKK